MLLVVFFVAIMYAPAHASSFEILSNRWRWVEYCRSKP
ncbi:Uncharacterised protein [Vibrio cholerae]|nr:Uncharacterised protein [Vibrio cholerae]